MVQSSTLGDFLILKSLQFFSFRFYAMALAPSRLTATAACGTPCPVQATSLPCRLASGKAGALASWSRGRVTLYRVSIFFTRKNVLKYDEI